MKTLNINEIVEQEKGPIWVINATNELYPSGADVYVTVTNNGQSQVFQVPRTWLPIEMTNRFPRKVIVESAYFVEALSKGLLKAISAETAASLLAQPGAAQERKRLEELEEAVKAATQTKGIGKNVTISTGDEDVDRQHQDEHNRRSREATDSFVKSSIAANRVNMGPDDHEDDAEEDSGVSPNFKGWVNKVNAIEDSSEARNEVRLRGNMEVVEAQYLLANCVHANVKASLEKKLKAIAD